MVVNTVTYTIKADSGHMLIAKGQSIKFDGWYKIYTYAKTKDSILPDAEEGENLDLKECNRSKHETQPPARYNDASLLKIMEKEGVGRPSTRANLIGMLLKKEYVEKQKGGKGFHATPLGMKISDYLSPRFKDFFMDITYTAALEDDLNEIAEGRKTFLEVVNMVYETLQDHIKDAKDIPVDKKVVDTGEKCTACKKHNIVEKDGRYGKFFTCAGYPDCKQIFEKDENGKFVEKQKKVAKKTGQKCQKCKDGNIVEKKGKFGVFYACDNYPKCKTIYVPSDDKDDGFQIKGYVKEK
jgi:DNA topoisomerase-1